MKKLILLAAGVMGTFALHADAQKKGVLATDFQFPMSILGKKIGSVSLKAGSSVCVVSVHDDGVLIARGDSDPVMVSKETLTPESLVVSSASPSPIPPPTNCIISPSNNQPNEVKIANRDLFSSSNATNQGYASQIHPRLIFPEKDEVIVVVPNNLSNNTFYEDVKTSNQLPQSQNSEQKIGYSYFYLVGKWEPTLQRAEPRSAIQTQSFEFTRDKYFCWTSSFERNGVTIATTYKYQVIIENNKIKMFNDKATTGFAGRRYEIILPYNPDILSISFVTKPEANFVQSPSGSLTLKRLEP